MLGAHSSSPTESAVYSQALYKLVTSAYLKPSTVLSHVSPRDNRMKYEAEERAKISGFPTAKELRHAKEVAEARLKQEESEAEKVGLVRAKPFLAIHSCQSFNTVEKKGNSTARSSFCEGR